MGYKPIEFYGVIGDLHTVALVGIDGSIDWCCMPHFDSPSVFAAILDDQKGGSFPSRAYPRRDCRPAFDFARRPHEVVLEGKGAVFEAQGMKVSLVSRFPLARHGDGVAAEFVLNPGETTTFILRQVEENSHGQRSRWRPARGAAGGRRGPDADPVLLAAVAEKVQLLRPLARDRPSLVTPKHPCRSRWGILRDACMSRAISLGGLRRLRQDLFTRTGLG